MYRILSALGARPWLTGLLVFLGLALASGAWAISTPLGASPDEPSHIIKAASVARGQLIGAPTDQPATTKVTVPGDLVLAPTWPCFAFQDETTASCQRPFVSGPDGVAKTSAGLYNPTYYALVGWPSLLTHNAKLTVFAMRAIGALVCSAFLAIGFVALRRLRIPFTLGLIMFASVTPMVLFLNASVNPNGLEIASGFALVCVLLALVRSEDTRGRGWQLALAFVSAAVLANMRGLSPLWVGLIGIVAILAALPGRLAELFRRPATWLTLAGIVITMGFAVAWILGTNTLNAMGTYPGAGSTPPYYAFVTMLLSRSVDPGFVGVFGWLDTFPPALVYAVWGALTGGLVLVAMIVARGRLLWAFLLALASLFLVPAVTQAGSVMKSGYIWQGRYALVAMCVLVVVAGVGVAVRVEAPIQRSTFVRRAVWTVTAVAVAGQLLALVFTIKRYSLGVGAEWLPFLRHPGWLPPGGAYLWLFVLAVGLAGVGVAWRAALVADLDLREPLGVQSVEERGAGVPSDEKVCAATADDPAATELLPGSAPVR